MSSLEKYLFMSSAHFSIGLLVFLVLSSGSNTSIGQNRLLNKDHNKRQARSLHNSKGVNPKEGITLINIEVPDIVAPKYIKKILEDFMREIERSTVMAGDFNTPLSTMDRSSRQNPTKTQWH